MTLRELERQAILQEIISCKGNKSKAARNLGIAVRTIQNKLSEYKKESLNALRSKAGICMESAEKTSTE